MQVLWDPWLPQSWEEARRRLRWRAPERTFAEVQFVELGCSAALPAPCRPLRWLTPERAYLEAELVELDGSAGQHAACRPLRCLAPERAYFEEEFVGLEGFAVQPVRWLVPGRAFVVDAPPVQCRPQ